MHDGFKGAMRFARFHALLTETCAEEEWTPHIVRLHRALARCIPRGHIRHRTNALFVCIHNSARSQMAEALMNRICTGSFVAQSAGIDPETLNPIVVEAMEEEGIDISRNATKSVADVIAGGARFDYVITVCDEARACTGVFPTPRNSPARTLAISLPSTKSATPSRRKSPPGARKIAPLSASPAAVARELSSP